jgi:hypothetical protein
VDDIDEPMSVDEQLGNDAYLAFEPALEFFYKHIDTLLARGTYHMSCPSSPFLPPGIGVHLEFHVDREPFTPPSGKP